MHLTSADVQQEHKARKDEQKSFFYANSFETLNIYLIAGVLKTIFLILLALSRSGKKVINGNVNLKIGFRNRFSLASLFFRFFPS